MAAFCGFCFLISSKHWKLVKRLSLIDYTSQDFDFIRDEILKLESPQYPFNDALLRFNPVDYLDNACIKVFLRDWILIFTLIIKDIKFGKFGGKAEEIITQ